MTDEYLVGRCVMYQLVAPDESDKPDMAYGLVTADDGVRVKTVHVDHVSRQHVFRERRRRDVLVSSDPMIERAFAPLRAKYLQGGY